MIISTPYDLPIFEKLLGDGSRLGCKFEYKVQEVPNGLAQAFVLGEEFIGDDKICLILGDNIFQMKRKTLESCNNINGSVIFGYHVHDPERYGVVEYDKNFKVLSIEEKPTNPKSNYAVPGLYFYDNTVVERAEALTPSARGELEITDLNNSYIADKKLRVKILRDSAAWFDTGTADAMFEAAMFVKSIQSRTGNMIGCIEEIAYRKGFITEDEFFQLVNKMPTSQYRKYLKDKRQILQYI